MLSTPTRIHLCAGILVLVTGISATWTTATAGDFGAVAFGFWRTVVDSYWWSTREDYLGSWDERGPHPLALLPGEVEPLGLENATRSYYPPNPENISCTDFRVVRFRDIDPADGSNFPFRVHYPKGVTYMTFEGWLAGIGRPSHAKFWIAAMLPVDAEPFFRESGKGLNPAVLRRPLLVDFGLSEGLAAMPAEKLVLRSKQSCEGFDIYVVEYER